MVSHPLLQGRIVSLYAWISLGRIEGCGCADNRKQRIYKSKEEMGAPTTKVNEPCKLSCIIDTNEWPAVATAHIPGAFIHMKLEGPLAKLLIRVDLKPYDKYSVIKKGKPVLYVQLMKSLYGTLQAALVFWQDLSSHLEKWGFKLNPYKWCVPNKMVNDKQCTILWHVDDLKISHADAEVGQARMSLDY
jgi:hypothetical protein